MAELKDLRVGQRVLVERWSMKVNRRTGHIAEIMADGRLYPVHVEYEGGGAAPWRPQDVTVLPDSNSIDDIEAWLVG